MHLTISTEGLTRKGLERDLREYAKLMLGRLRYNIAHAELELNKENEGDLGSMHICSLRLRFHEAADVRVLARGAGSGKALARAFR